MMLTTQFSPKVDVDLSGFGYKLVTNKPGPCSLAGTWQDDIENNEQTILNN